MYLPYVVFHVIIKLLMDHSLLIFDINRVSKMNFWEAKPTQWQPNTLQSPDSCRILYHRRQDHCLAFLTCLFILNVLCTEFNIQNIDFKLLKFETSDILEVPFWCVENVVFTNHSVFYLLQFHQSYPKWITCNWLWYIFCDKIK